MNSGSYTFPHNTRELAYSKNGMYLAICGESTDIHILYANNVSYFRTLTSTNTVIDDIDFSYDNNLILACGYGAKLNMWYLSNWIALPEHSTIADGWGC